MKIVIDIPEEVFDEIYNENYYSLKGKEALRVAVRNGTPFPKGHGRLIDADSMKTMKNIQSANFNDVESIRLWIDNQQTIIEADKGESE